MLKKNPDINSHPVRVYEVEGEQFTANSHPYLVKFSGGTDYYTKEEIDEIGYVIDSAFVGANEFAINGRINIGGTIYAGCTQFSIRDWAGNYAASNSNSLIQWIPANTTVKIQACMSNYSGSVNCTMNYIQIY